MGWQGAELYLEVTWSAELVDRAPARLVRTKDGKPQMCTTSGMCFSLESPLGALSNENARDYRVFKS